MYSAVQHGSTSSGKRVSKAAMNLIAVSFLVEGMLAQTIESIATLVEADLWNGFLALHKSRCVETLQS